MADIQVNITSQSEVAAAESLAQFARKQRIHAHLAQSRRARQSSRFDDKSAAAQARIQRRLAAQRKDTVAIQTGSLEIDRLAEADRKARPEATDAQRTIPEAEEDPTSVQPWPDSLAQLRKLRWGDSPSAAPSPEATAEATIARRGVGIQSPAAAFPGPQQGEIARLQAKAKAETQRADLVTALLEDVLNASTARIVKHQARLEAMQAQINALHGR